MTRRLSSTKAAGLRRIWRAVGLLLAAWWLATLAGLALAATYTSASVPFAWEDTATHTKVGYNTTPYKFNGGAAAGCATSTPPVLDDTISDAIPIGFSFLFGSTSYTSLRIQTNGRLQFNNAFCGHGTQAIGPPQTYPFTYPNGSLNNTMKIFGVDLDPTNLADRASYPTAGSKTTCLAIATCYVSYATLGTAPTRRFVITWVNVPEWVTASNTSGSFDLQIILYENGTFVYQYGEISHGGTGVAEVGWQLSTSDYSVITFGASAEPPVGTAVLFYVPFAAALARFEFEEGAWGAGQAGHVRDASGNNYHGSILGNVTPASTGKVCRGALIATNTTAAGVDAVKTGVRFSDPGVNMQGQGTVMFWYRSSVGWSGAGAVAAQLLDATQASGQWFSLTKTATGTLYFQVTDSTGTSRAVETPAQSYAADTWVHIAVSWNFNALAAANSDHLQIVVDGGTPASVSFTTTGSLSASLDYLHAGDNPSGFTGAKGTVNSARGTIDELRVYNVELTQGQVLAASAETHSCPSFAIDHFELRHATWSGIACSPGTLTVVACAVGSPGTELEFAL